MASLTGMINTSLFKAMILACRKPPHCQSWLADRQWMTTFSSLSVKRLLMLGGKHDSSFEWPFEWAVGTIIHCSFSCLACSWYDWKHKGGHHSEDTWGEHFCMDHYFWCILLVLRSIWPELEKTWVKWGVLQQFSIPLPRSCWTQRGPYNP